jgi:tetratricopeptide (TPR) repeat protein
VWGTPRYAILRVYRGLTKKGNDAEEGWQQLKPSAVPEAPKDRVEKMLKNKESLEDLMQMASEAKEGGDAALRLSILKKATELFPVPQALTAYADALIEESRSQASVLEKGDFFQLARKCWDKVLDENPAHIEGLLGKGRYLTMMAYRGGDDPAEGMKILQKALEQKPGGRQEAEIRFYLGMGYRRLGKEVDAKTHFQKAVLADPAFTLPKIALSS